MATYITLPPLSPGQVLTASYLNQLNDNLRVIGLHNHSGSLGEGSGVIVSGSSASPHTNRYEIICHIAPSQLNFASFSTNAVLFGGFQQSGSSTPACIAFPVSLFAGSYQFILMHEKNSDLGIASLFVGTTAGSSGSVQGEIDFYSSGQQKNSKTTVSVVIPTTGSYAITLYANTNKNTSSTGSRIRFQAFKIKKV